MYRLGAVCPGSSDEVSINRRCSRVYEPKGWGLYVREMWVMRVEVGEGVGLLVKEGLPLGAGKNMSIVAGVAAVPWLIFLSTTRILSSVDFSNSVSKSSISILPMSSSRVK